MRILAYRTLRTAFLAPLVLCSAVQTLWADPLIITNGSLTIYWDSSATPFTFSGAGFMVNGGAPGGSAATSATPGELLDVSTTVQGSELGFGPARVGAFVGEAFYDGSLVFRAEPVLVPSTAESVLTFMTRFAMSGQLFGYATVDRSGPPLFSLMLAGSGTATIGPFKNTGGPLVLNSGGLTFQFEDPATVPEPASMLLLGSGLAAMAAARRRQRSRLLKLRSTASSSSSRRHAVSRPACSRAPAG